MYSLCDKKINFLLGYSVFFLGIGISAILVFAPLGKKGIDEQRLSDVQECLVPVNQAIDLTQIKLAERNSKLKEGKNCLLALPYGQDNINYQNVISLSTEIINGNGEQGLTGQLENNVEALTNNLESETTWGWFNQKGFKPFMLLFMTMSFSFCLLILIY